MAKEKAAVNITQFVVYELKAGTSKAAIIDHLAEKGIKKADAEKFVHSVHAAAVDAGRKERLSAKSLPLAILGAALAAIIGGVIWGMITVLTNYEIGFVAVGVGFLAGLAVTKLSGGKKGIQLQIIAVVASLMGILIGKYIFFVHSVSEALAKELGQEIALSYFSPLGIAVFFSGLRHVFGAFDILWVILAVATAWSIPKAIGIKQQNSTHL